MAYMDTNAVFASGIQELSFDEIKLVFAGGSTAPKAPTCPSGMKLESATYDGQGRLKEYKCVNSGTSDKVQEAAGFVDKLADAADKIAGLLGF